MAKRTTWLDSINPGKTLRAHACRYIYIFFICSSRVLHRVPNGDRFRSTQASFGRSIDQSRNRFNGLARRRTNKCIRSPSFLLCPILSIHLLTNNAMLPQSTAVPLTCLPARRCFPSLRLTAIPSSHASSCIDHSFIADPTPNSIIACRARIAMGYMYHAGDSKAKPVLSSGARPRFYQPRASWRTAAALERTPPAWSTVVCRQRAGWMIESEAYTSPQIGLRTRKGLWGRGRRHHKKEVDADRGVVCVI